MCEGLKVRWILPLASILSLSVLSFGQDSAPLLYVPLSIPGADWNRGYCLPGIDVAWPSLNFTDTGSDGSTISFSSNMGPSNFSFTLTEIGNTCSMGVFIVYARGTPGDHFEVTYNCQLVPTYD